VFSPPRDIQSRVDWLLRKYRPRVLITHWEGAERLLPWVTYRRNVRLVCHRYRVAVLPLRLSQRMLYSMVKAFVVPAGGLEEFVRAAGVQESRITSFPLCPVGIEGGEVDGVVLGVLPASQKKVAGVLRHLEKHQPHIPVLQGTAEELLSKASILLDLGEGIEVRREYMDAVQQGKVVLVPDTELFRSLYGDRVTYYKPPHLFALLRDLFQDMPKAEESDCATVLSAVQSIGSAYRKAAA